MTQLEVVDAVASQDAALAASLAHAFLDDPLMCWLLPAAHRRLGAMTRFFGQELRHARRAGLALTTTRGGVAALWYPPQRWRMTRGEMVRGLPASVSAFGPRGLLRALGVLAAMESVHPVEPHWYLSVIGAEPAHRGSGAAGALIRAVTDRCDAEGLPGYLESSKESNLGYYRRFGFEVSGEIATPGGGPMQWSMWRAPAC